MERTDSKDGELSMTNSEWEGEIVAGRAVWEEAVRDVHWG